MNTDNFVWAFAIMGGALILGGIVLGFVLRWLFAGLVTWWFAGLFA